MPVAARAVMRSAAALWSPVRAASNSIASNSSRFRTATFTNVPSGWRVPTRQSAPMHRLPSCAFQRFPETAAQRMAYLVMKERVNRQDRTLEQPRLKVRRHPRLTRQHGLEPQARGVPAHRLAEGESFAVCRLHLLGKRDSDRLRMAD